MYEAFVRERISQLRMQKGISEYRMSYDLGHCRGYINNISSGKSLPSMSEFFAICEYLDITPSEFFDSGNKSPELLRQTVDKLRSLSGEDLELIDRCIVRLMK